MFYLRQGKSAVETGELRNKIDIGVEGTETNRKTGIQKTVYNSILSTRAKVIGESGKSFLCADRELHQVRKRVFLRKRKNLRLTEKHYIRLEDGYVYKIYSLNDYDVMFYELLLQRIEQ